MKNYSAYGKGDNNFLNLSIFLGSAELQSIKRLHSISENAFNVEKSLFCVMYTSVP